MIFVDTGAWYALSDPQERRHTDALSLFGKISSGRFGRVLTTDYVLDEAYTLVRMRLGLPAVRSLHKLTTSSKSLQLLRVSENDFEKAVQLMLGHEDKRWSLTDCTSFVLLHELGVVDAFTFDRNFTEAGFRMHPEL